MGRSTSVLTGSGSTWFSALILWICDIIVGIIDRLMMIQDSSTYNIISPLYLCQLDHIWIYYPYIWHSTVSQLESVLLINSMIPQLDLSYHSQTYHFSTFLWAMDEVVLHPGMLTPDAQAPKICLLHIPNINQIEQVIDLWIID